MEHMQRMPRSTRHPAVRRRRVALGIVAAVAVAGGGWALAAGSGGGAPAGAPVAPNRGSAVRGGGGSAQREVAVQPLLAEPNRGATTPGR
jgi:hypothetical protein